MGPLELAPLVNVAKAMTLVALLALVVAACGHSGSDDTDEDHTTAVGIELRRLPFTLDLDRVAGLQISSAPRCRFGNRTSTALSTTEPVSQALPLTCAGGYVGGAVRTYRDARAVRQQPPRCFTDKRGGEVLCEMQHASLYMNTYAPCAECERAAEHRAVAEASTLMSRIVKLFEGFPSGATPAFDIDPAALSPPIDLGRLAGRPISGPHLHACAFDAALVERGRGRTARLGLRCGSWAAGVLAVGPTPAPTPSPVPGATPTIGPMAPAAEHWDRTIATAPHTQNFDSVECTRDARQSACYVRHSSVELSTLVECPGPRQGPESASCGHGASPSALMAAVARMLP